MIVPASLTTTQVSLLFIMISVVHLIIFIFIAEIVSPTQDIVEDAHCPYRLYEDE